MYTNWGKIIENSGLFWQYPVITEKSFYEQNRTFSNFIPFPWATVLDKNINLEQVREFLLEHINSEVEYYTCCQHIRFRELIPLFKSLNISIVYTPHKCLGEEQINGIKLLPCPLYAVNFEDKTKNSKFIGCDFINKNRKYLFSFIGGLQPGYLSTIRQEIFKLPRKLDVFIENSGEWHFNEIVYTTKQNHKQEYSESKKHRDRTEEYNSVLLNSRFSLCPSGTGPNSIRFWESLACGSIPVLLSDTLELPNHSLWKDAVIFIKEKDFKDIYKILSKVSTAEESSRRENCIKIYNYFKSRFTGEDKKTIIHYCCGTYYRGNLGGVACYDYQITKIFPHRVFFEGPREKQSLLNFLDSCKDPIIITDNHLSCDIPNKYKTLIVHHGVAQTHADREPEWDLYWKDLCCNGQYRMLYYRDVENTKFISSSQFCTEEFSKHYSSEYDKFSATKILHSSEFNESLIKKKWNNTPIVLGNWSTNNKGRDIVSRLNVFMEKEFKFKNLNVYMNRGIKSFIEQKQAEYIDSDLFLQLSLSEGNSYASLDALLCGIPVVASDVGLFYKDVPDDCFVRIDWRKNQDLDYVAEKIRYAWENRDELSKNARNWYLKNCSYVHWRDKMINILQEFST